MVKEIEKLITTWTKDGKPFQYIAVTLDDLAVPQSTEKRPSSEPSRSPKP